MSDDGGVIDLDAAVTDARQRYADRRPNSARLAAEAATVMPGGNTRSVLHFAPFPFRVATAHGARITDVDGFTYVDLLGNYTAGLLGHSPDAVKRAVVERLEQGWSIGATHELEIELARLVCERFTSIEQVRFTNSGTEANLMAIGLAKHHTGRAGVVVFEEGYHGGVLSFAHGGSPLNVPHEFVVLPFDAVEALDAVDERVACAVVEPVQGSGGCRVASSAFLEALRRRTAEVGALLVFDEVMTSRLHPGGAQARFGITPDLTTLGKYLGGGMSFGAFGGRRSIMQAFDPAVGGPLTQAGTFNNNVVSMAAGAAAMRHVLTPEKLVAVNDRGDALRERLADLFAATGVPLATNGLGSMLQIEAPDDRWRELFFHAMVDASFYLARRGMIALSFEVTDGDLDGFCAAAEAWCLDVR